MPNERFMLNRSGPLQAAPAHILENLHGGVMAAITSLPGTIVFGTVAFAPLGERFVARGIAASLTGSVILGALVALFGASRLMVAGPRSHTVIIMASVFTVLSAAMPGLSDEPGAPLALIAAGALTTAVVGLIQVLLGLFRVGGFVRYLPWPVLSGFLNATALMILFRQFAGILGVSGDRPLWDLFTSPVEIKVMRVLLALFTACVVILTRRRRTWLPAPLIGLLAGSFLYHTLSAMIHGFDAGPTLAVADSGGSSLAHLATVPQLIRENTIQSLWGAILPAAFSIAALCSLSTLMCMATIDELTGRRSDPNQELMAHGLGNMFTAFFGGLPGAGKPGASVLAIRTGGNSRILGGFTALTYLLILLGLSPLVGCIPVCVLCGMVIPIAAVFFDDLAARLVRSLIDRNWKNLRSEGSDYLILSAIVVVSIIIDITTAMACGAGLSIVFFLIRSSRCPIHSELSAISFRSPCVHSRATTLQGETFGRIMVLELRGVFFFGSAAALPERIERRVRQGCGYVILDCSRVTDMDSTGAKLLVKLARSLHLRGVIMAFSCLKTEGHLFDLLLRQGMPGALWKAFSFPNTDHAIRWCENHLQENLPAQPAQAAVLPADIPPIPSISWIAAGAPATCLTVPAGRSHENFTLFLQRGDWVYRHPP